MVHAQTDDLDLGARLFAENCAVCHGEDGQGKIGATLNKDWPSIRPDLTVRNVIVNGIPGSPMPAWSEANGGPLNEQEIKSLTNYILSWETGGVRPILPLPTARARPTLSVPPDIEGNPNRGAALYDQNCAVCHGLEGDGRIGANLSPNWSAIRPGLRVFSTIANGVDGSVMPAWSQVQGGPLSEIDIQDITAYIFTLEPADTMDVPRPSPEPFQASWLAGWGGVVLALGLFGAILVLAWAMQRNPVE